MLWFSIQKRNQRDIPAESRDERRSYIPTPSALQQLSFQDVSCLLVMLTNASTATGQLWHSHLPEVQWRADLTPLPGSQWFLGNFYHALRLIGVSWVTVFQLCSNFKSHQNKENFGVSRDHGFRDPHLRWYDPLDAQWLQSGDKS